MLNLIIAVLVPFLVTTAGGQTATNIEVIEIFRAETTEELEAALTDGYPMLWLEEILNDESIPEEDRYWLDCRVRAVFAQDLHLFFDEEGNPVHVEADWIKYGEYYWQENFIVNPPGDYRIGEFNPETGLLGETGFIYNYFGEKTGNLALCSKRMILSRDGSVGLLPHICSDYEEEASGPVYLFFVYSDGSYHMNPDRLLYCEFTLSQRGDYALLRQGNGIASDPIQLFNREGELLWEQYATASGGTGEYLVILPNDENCLIPSADWEGGLTRIYQMLSITDGSEVVIFTPEMSMRTSYSQDGNLLFIGEQCVSLTKNDTEFSIPESILSDFTLMGNACSQDGDYFAITVQRKGAIDTYFLLYNRSGELLLEELYVRGQRMLLSPNGAFALSGPYQVSCDASSIPFTIWKTGGDL